MLTVNKKVPALKLEQIKEVYNYKFNTDGSLEC